MRHISDLALDIAYRLLLPRCRAPTAVSRTGSDPVSVRHPTTNHGNQRPGRRASNSTVHILRSTDTRAALSVHCSGRTPVASSVWACRAGVESRGGLEWALGPRPRLRKSEKTEREIRTRRTRLRLQRSGLPTGAAVRPRHSGQPRSRRCGAGRRRRPAPAPAGAARGSSDVTCRGASRVVFGIRYNGCRLKLACATEMP